MEINILEKVDINNSWQWVLVRSKNTDAPLILHVQAGPGLPIIPEADALERLLCLEDKYLVAYWDQRGCGKSFNKFIDPGTINISQLADDVIECTKYLLNRYGKDKVVLIGYSIGATISLLAAQKDSSIFSQLFLVGTDIDIPFANKYVLEFILSKAKEKNNKRILKLAARLESKPIINAKIFRERAKLLTDLGGIRTGTNYNQLVMLSIRNMLFSKAYSYRDILKTIKGMEFCQNALLPEVDSLNLFSQIKEVHVPVHFIQGRLDGIAPNQTAIKFYDYLQADTKSFTLFDNSAHTPHYEEPGKFRRLMDDKIFKANKV